MDLTMKSNIFPYLWKWWGGSGQILIWMTWLLTIWPNRLNTIVASADYQLIWRVQTIAHLKRLLSENKSYFILKAVSSKRRAQECPTAPKQPSVALMLLNTPWGFPIQYYSDPWPWYLTFPSPQLQKSNSDGPFKRGAAAAAMESWHVCAATPI